MKTFNERNYKIFNPNPTWTGKGKYDREDCSMRALCAATGKSWEEVYDIICEAGKRVYDVPNSDKSIELVLTEMGYKKVSIKAVKGSVRPTPSSLTKEMPNKSLVMRVANHWVGGRDGNYMDCWDCGYKGIYTYYEKEI